MAQPSADGEQTGVLVPQRSSAVRVDAETLTFDVAADLGTAAVKAAYRMTNTGAAPAAPEVAFVFVRGDHDRAAEPSITLDGQAVPFTLTGDESRLASGWSTLSSSRKLAFLFFHLDFAPGQTRAVTVAYTQEASWDRGHTANTVYGFDYLLSPARSWASFGPLDISVRVPPGTRLTPGSPALTRDGDRYRAALPSLPTGELHFDVMSERGLWFGMASTDGYLTILASALWLSTVAIGVAMGRRWTQAGCRPALAGFFGAWIFATMASGALFLLAGATFPDRGLGYGGSILAFGLVFLSGPVGAGVSFVTSWQRARLRPSP
jgi:hypothetical protein